MLQRDYKSLDPVCHDGSTNQWVYVPSEPLPVQLGSEGSATREQFRCSKPPDNVYPGWATLVFRP